MSAFNLPGMRSMHWAQQLEDTEREIAARELDHWLADETKCQAAHEDPRNKECSGDVTHVHVYCRGPKVVCSNTAAYVQFVLSGDASWYCSYCGAKCRTHWRIVPA